MSRTDEILKQLKEIANDPKKAMDDYKKETGKGAIGIMPLYAPEELVMLPDICLWEFGAEARRFQRQEHIFLPLPAP